MTRKAGVGRAEMDILRWIADNAPTTVRQVADYLAEAKGQTRTTALNVMERLREKGYLVREQNDGVYQYSPAQPKASLFEGLVSDFVDQALGGSLQPFVAYLAREPRQVSDSDLQELKKLVESLEAERGKEEAK